MKKNIIVKMRDYDIDVITNGVDNFDKVVICFHGFNGDKWGDAYSGLKHLVTNSLVCSFNSCGHGDSEVLSEDMRLDIILREIDVVIERIRKLTENRPIILVGVSYGGYRVMQYLIKYKPLISKVIYINPAFKMLETLQKTKDFKYENLKSNDKIIMKRSLNKFIKKEFLDDLFVNNLYSKTYDIDYDSRIIVGKKDTLILLDDTLEIAKKYGYDVTFVDDGHCFENKENWNVVVDML